MSIPKILPKLSLWCIALGKPARPFNSFIVWSWELNLLFTDPSLVTPHEHQSAYIIPFRFSSTHRFKNQSHRRSIISVPFLGYMSQVLICQLWTNAAYSAAFFFSMRKEKLFLLFLQPKYPNKLMVWMNKCIYLSNSTEFPVVFLFTFSEFSNSFTTPLGRWFFETFIKICLNYPHLILPWA